MIKTLRRISAMLFGAAVPFRAKLFNVLVLGSLFIALSVCIFSLGMGMNIANTLGSGAIVPLAAGLLLLGGRTRRYQLCYLIAVILVFFGLYPVFFFSAGGYLSGMPSFFVFAPVFTVFMLEGWKALVVSLAEIVFYAVLCVYAHYNPERVSWFTTEFIVMSDVIIGFFSVSTVLGITLFVYLGLYKKQQQELKEQTRMAESASDAKTSFLARMSHEIRTPLNAILGLSEVELQGKLPDRTRINLGKIYHSGSHLLEIVNDILDISKIESGNFEILPEEYEFPVLINDTVQLNIPRIGSKHIDFKLELDETIPVKFYGDELRIKQILNNLLSNAFKYTGEGEVRLLITWKKQGDEAWLTLTVEDTGRGIKEEDLGKLFSEYTQLDAGANRRIEGTGLGLSITRGLTELMGGSISVESDYGKGSVFKVRLPQAIVDETPIGRETAENLRNFRFIGDRNRGSTILRSWMPYGKVLVVDDVPMNLDVIKGLLMPYGLRVDAVLSGREAVERVKAEKLRYDLIFMDHMMPEMDGLEAVKIIRNEIQSDYARTVPIVVLTANAVAGNREMFLESGFNDFISKPIDIKRLDMTLNQWVRDTQSKETLREVEREARDKTDAAGSLPGDAGGAEKGDPKGRWLLEHPVEGIDFEAALTLYGSNGAAFMPILKSFIAHTPSLLEKMDRHLETSLPEYTIEVHGLKGACNTIGAKDIAALASDLETVSKVGDVGLLRIRHGELRQQSLELIGRLRSLLSEWEDGHPIQEKEQRAEPEKALLARLSAAVAGFDSNTAEEILEKLEGYRYEQGQEFIEWLREQAENFDYDVMCKGLTEFLGNI